jgi:hypothetical protein
MSVNNFIPEIWSAAALDVLEKNLVYGALANRDYEGEIWANGNTVYINEIGDITISTYVKNSTTAIVSQRLTDASQTMYIDQQKYFSFTVDDVDKAQVKPKLMDKAMERAGYNMRDNIDQNLATYLSTSGNFFAGANSTELGSTVTALSCASTAVIVALSWFDRLMNQNNVPYSGRWVVVPPAIAQQLQMARIIAPQGLPNGVAPQGAVSVGNYYGLNIYVSNNCYGVISSQWHVIAGHPMAFSYAGQLSQVEALRDPNSFGDIVRGLQVFGRKVTRPNCIIKGVLTSS